MDTSKSLFINMSPCYFRDCFQQAVTFVLLLLLLVSNCEVSLVTGAPATEVGDNTSSRSSAHGANNEKVKPQQKQLCDGLCICDKPMKHINCTQVGISTLTSIAIPESVQSLLLDRNSISVLPAGIVQKLPNLIFLGISRNKLSKVESQSICSGNQLRHLVLDYNYLSEIPEGLFTNCSRMLTLQMKVNYLIVEQVAKFLPLMTNLKTLDLSNNKFQNSSTLPHEFSTLKNLQYLYLDDVDIHNLADDFFQGLDTSKLVELSLMKNVIMKVSNRSFANMDSLELLDLSLTEITVEHAKDIFLGLQNSRHLHHLNLKYVFVDGNNEDELDTHFFRELYNTSLRILHMEGNYGGFHGSLSKSFFSHVHHLQQLYLDHNELRTIHPKTFHRLHKLKKLSLRRNYLSCLVDCEFLHGSAVFPSLEDLDLSSNVIDDSAGYASFSSDYFPKLRHLNLRKNRLSVIGADTFQSLRGLRSLDLSENPIYSVQEGSFDGSVKLKSLIMEDCYHINTLPRQLFRGLTHLQLLKLNGNGIRSLQSDALYGLTSLLHLELRNNHLGGPANTLYNMSMPSHNLTVLDLSYNEIEVLPLNMLQNISLLSVLNVSHNRLVRLDGSNLSGNRHLRRLDLSYNDLLTITEHTFDGFENLTELNLEGNPFYCDCELKASKEWLIENQKIVLQLQNTKCAGPLKHIGIPLLEYQNRWTCGHLLTVEISLLVSGTIFCLVCIPVLIFQYRKHRKLADKPGNSKTNGKTPKRKMKGRKGSDSSTSGKETDTGDSQTTGTTINGIETVNIISHSTDSEQHHMNGDCSDRSATKNKQNSSGCFSLSDLFKKRKSHTGSASTNGVNSSGHEPLINDNISLHESQSAM